MRTGDLCGWWRRITHIPLTDTRAMSSFKKVEMDVVVVIAVSARSQDRGKAMAGRIAQRLTHGFRNVFISELGVTVAGENQGADIDGVAFAMFAKFGIDHTVAAAALVRTVGLDTAKYGAQRSGVG